MKSISLHAAELQVHNGWWKDEVFLCTDPYTSINLKKVFSIFFISHSIRGNLYESETPDIYILKDIQWVCYIVISYNYSHLLLKHYVLTLKADVSSYKKYCSEKNIYFSSQVLDNLQEHISLYKTQCDNFCQKYTKLLLDNYDQIQELRQLINQYAWLRTQLHGNAESLYDSKNSNNFLLLGVTALFDASYARVKNWVTQEYENYIQNIIGLQEVQDHKLYLTNSWMQAISRVIKYELSQRKKNICIYGIVYFETIKILESYFGKEHITYFDPWCNIEQLPTYLKDHCIDVIFIDTSTISFDSYSLSPKVFYNICEQVQEVDKNIDIIFDTTSKYIYHENYIPPKYYKNNIIYVGSVGKYLYGWMDLGFSGYMFIPKNIENTDISFANSGIGIKTIDSMKIPIFPKYIHIQLAQKIQENTQIIQKHWEQKKNQYPNISVSFPHIPSDNTSDFFWSLINITYTKQHTSYNTISEHKELIVESTLSSGKKQGIDICYSTSYGFYNTRISIFNCQGIEATSIDHPCYVRLSIWYMSNPIEVIKVLHIITKVLVYIEKNKT